MSGSAEQSYLDAFDRTGARLSGHFLLSSGLHSAGYLQCALVLSHLRREVEGNYRQGARDRTGLPVDVPRILRSNATFAQKSEAFFHLTNNFAYPLLLLLSLLLLPNLVLRTTHGVREVLMIDLPLFFGTTLSIQLVCVLGALWLGRPRAPAV